MEFIEANFINTTTQITVDSNTSGAENLFNRDPVIQYFTSGFNNDLTQASITIAFTETLSVSRIIMQNHNLKSFDVFFNGATASTFSLTGSTIASTFTTNSETSLYMTADAVNATSVTLDMKTTIVANSDKAIGLFALSALKLDFDRIPSSKNYNPLLAPKEIVHTLSDGGTRVHTVQDKKRAQVKFKFITTSFRDDLKDVFDEHGEFMFVAFPTMTAWDEFFFEAVWPSPFGFFKFSLDAASAGFSGTINLRETAI